MKTKQLTIVCITFLIYVGIMCGVNYFKAIELKMLEIESQNVRAEVEKDIQQEKSERAWMHRMPFLKTKKGDE